MSSEVNSCEGKGSEKRESQPSSGLLFFSLRRFSSCSFLKTSAETRPAFPPESILGPWEENRKNGVGLVKWTLHEHSTFRGKKIEHHALKCLFAHLWLAGPTRWRQIFIRVLSTSWPPPWRRLVGVWSSSLLGLFPWRRLVKVWIVPVLSPLCQRWPLRIRWTTFIGLSSGRGWIWWRNNEWFREEFI